MPNATKHPRPITEAVVALQRAAEQLVADEALNLAEITRLQTALRRGKEWTCTDCGSAAWLRCPKCEPPDAAWPLSMPSAVRMDMPLSNARALGGADGRCSP